MWRSVFILAIATFAASTVMETTPEELQQRYEELQMEIESTQKMYLQGYYIGVYLEYLERFENATINMMNEALERSADYFNAVTEVLEAFEKIQRRALLECIQKVNEDLTSYTNQIVSNVSSGFNAKLDQLLENYKVIIFNLDDGFYEMEEQVQNCSNTTCAAELDVTLTELNDTINEQGTKLDAEAAELDKAVENVKLDQSFDEKIQSLIADAKNCSEN